MSRNPATRRTATAPAEGLSKQRIVAAALAAIDAEGLDAFSIRGLAQSLGVYPTALYWHIPNRNALLAAVTGLALEGVVPGASNSDWQEWLKELFRRYRATVRRHPNIASLLGAQLVSNAGVDPVMVEAILRNLTKGGFNGTRLVHAFNTTIATMCGFVTLEFGPSPSDSNGDWVAEFREALHAVDPASFPLFAANLSRLENKAFITRWQNGAEAPLDDSFEAYIDVVVTGLAQAKGRGPGRHSSDK